VKTCEFVLSGQTNTVKANPHSLINHNKTDSFRLKIRVGTNALKCTSFAKFCTVYIMHIPENTVLINSI
jgi:hypothetical protein